MSISRFGRFVVVLAAAMFAAVGLELWLVPEQAAHRFGLEAIRIGGVAALTATGR